MAEHRARVLRSHRDRIRRRRVLGLLTYRPTLLRSIIGLSRMLDVADKRV